MKRMTRNIIIPIIIFCIFFIIFFLFSIVRKVFNYEVFVFNDNKYILYQESNNEWKSISKSDFTKSYTDITYDLYVDNESKGNIKYEIINNKLEMTIDPNKTVTRYTRGKLLTYGGTSKVNYVEFREDKDYGENEDIILKQLMRNNLEKDYNVSYIKKYKVSFNGDNIRSSNIYIISNMVNYNKTKINDDLKKVFSFMFLERNNKIYNIYSKVVNDSDLKNICLPSLDGIFSFANDNSYKIISNCEYLSDDTYKLNLYDYKNNKISRININN